MGKKPKTELHDAIIIDGGGTTWLTEPTPYNYLKAAKLSGLKGRERDAAVAAAITRGDIMPYELPNVSEALEMLSKKYGVFLFSDATDELTRLFLYPLRARKYFPDERVIWNNSAPRGNGKRNPDNWKSATEHMRRHGYEAKAFVEDDLGAALAALTAADMTAYLIIPGRMLEQKSVYIGRSISYCVAGSLLDAARDILTHNF